MILKTSYKNLYCQEAKRNLFLTAINTFGIFLALPFFFLQQIVSFGTDYGVAFRFAKNNLIHFRDQSLNQISYDNKALVYVLIMLAVLNGITLFSYLFSKNKQDFYFSQPVTRKALFWITYMQGIVNLIVPYVLNLILVFILAAANHCLSGTFFVILLQTFGIFSLFYLATYSLAVLASALTGKLFYAILGTGVFLFYGPFLYEIVDYFFDQSLTRLDIAASKIYLLSPITIFAWMSDDNWERFHLENKEIIHVIHYDMSQIIALVLMFIISLVIARLTFLRRNAGETGKTIVFYWVKKVVKAFLVIITVLFFACNFSSMYEEYSVRHSIIGIVVGILCSIVVYDLILEQNWKGCIRNWKEQGIYIAISIIAFASINAYQDHYRYKGFNEIPSDYSVEEALSDGCVVVNEETFEYIDWYTGYAVDFPVYKDFQGIENLDQFVKDVNAGKDTKLRMVNTFYEPKEYYDLIYKNGVIERYSSYDYFGKGRKYSQIVRLSGKVFEDEPERVCYVLTNKKNFSFEDFKNEIAGDHTWRENFKCIFSFETMKADGGNEK